MSNNYKYIAIMGPTASGKTQLSYQVSDLWGSEIVCCDSIQVYKGFDIGSATPTNIELGKIPHHLFNICDPNEEFDAMNYVTTANKALTDIKKRGNLPLVVGGSGLYLRALMGSSWNTGLPKDRIVRQNLESSSTENLYKKLENHDPIRASNLHSNDRIRIIRALEIFEITGKTATQLYQNNNDSLVDNFFVIHLNPDKELVANNIISRSKEIIKNGIIEEVEMLLNSGVDRSAKPFLSIGYRQVLDFIDGKIDSNEELLNRIIIATRQYAKRQRTFFKKMPFQLELKNNVLSQNQLDQIRKAIG